MPLPSYVNKGMSWAYKTVRYPRSYVDYLRSQRREISVSDIKSVCLVTGPYRNLTTLIAGIIALHPACQVLNHAAGRIFSVKNANFLLKYSDARFNNFLRLAIFLSCRGSRGRYGGSIVFSHAFHQEFINNAYQQRYGESLIKKDIQCLFWKDSMRISNYIKFNKVNINDLLDQNTKLRFLMPIRNPLDCAISNYKTRHGKFLITTRYSDVKRFLSDLNNYSKENILDGILREISWFLKIHKDHPERFFYFFENEFDEELLSKLAKFLRIEPDSRWVHDSLNSYQLKSSYNHDQDFIDYYNRLIQTYFHEHKIVFEKLAKFSTLSSIT